MKARESGMPDELTWEGFFKPPEILHSMGIDDTVGNVAEFGCGYGTFTIPTARVICGKIYAFDIEPEMIKKVSTRSTESGINNVVAELRDFAESGSGLADGSVSYAMLFNILHLEFPEELLKEAYRILESGGKAGIIHWNYDASTPRGPPMQIRPRPERCIEWAVASGFYFIKRLNLRPYHYGLVFQKPYR